MEDDSQQPQAKHAKTSHEDEVSTAILLQLAQLRVDLKEEQEKQQAETDAKLEAIQEETDAKLEAMQEEKEAEIKAVKAEQAEQHAKLKEEQAKQHAELKEEVENLKKNRSRKGTTTQAQFVELLLKHNELRIAKQEEVWSGVAQELPLPKDTQIEPRENAKESNSRNKADPSTVQYIVSNVLTLLKEHFEKKGGNKSRPDPDAYKKVSFGSRKPDIVNYTKDCTGSLAITAFGDCKRRDTGDFTNEEIGHILDMALAFMECVSYYRQFVIVFLTDGKRWQFFRVLRHGKEKLVYLHAPVIDDGTMGWKHYVALLTADLTDVGYWEPTLPHTTLKYPLGRGGSAVAYQATYNKKNVVAKVFDRDKIKSFEREGSALDELANQNTKGVPRIDARVDVENTTDSLPGKALIVSPVGEVIDKESLYGKHLKELVEIVRKSHGCGLLHRDIKPDNVYLWEKSMLLNDWSSAIKASEQGADWEGTLGFSVNPHDPDFNLGGQVRDLISVVRTAYTLLFQVRPPGKEDAHKFWKKHIREGTLWHNAMEHAKRKQYEKLGELLFTLK